MDDATATRKSGTDLEQERAVWRDLVPAIGVLAVAFGAMFATDADGPSFASAAWSILTLTVRSAASSRAPAVAASR